MNKLTNDQKSRLLNNESLWPKCHHCGKSIPPVTNKQGHVRYSAWMVRKYDTIQCAAAVNLPKAKKDFVPREEKLKIMADKNQWPKCKTCGGEVSYRRFIRPKTGWIRWTDWRKCDNCSPECKRIREPTTIKKLAAKFSERPRPKAKTCSTPGCKKRFSRPPHTNNKQWDRITQCSAHRASRSGNVSERPIAVARAFGKPVVRGFYVFDMPKPEAEERVNPYSSGMDGFMADYRDFVVSAAINSLKS